MSDTPQGPGWWQASDDKWYPPPRPVMPGEEAPPGAAPAPTAPAPGVAGPSGPAVPPFGPPPGSVPPGAPPGVPSGGYPAGPPTAPVPGPPLTPGSGPYGSVPPGMPGAPGAAPPGDGNRTPLFVVLGVLGAAAVVLLIFLLAGGDDDTADPQDPTETTDPSTPGTTGPEGPDPTDGPTEPQDDGDVQVVDQGFSNFEDSGEAAGSFGFILENTGENILQSVETQVVIYGSGDRVITTKDFTIGTIRPGEQMGFGDEMFGEDLQDGIERLEIQVRNDSAELANPADVPEGGFEVTNVEVSNDDYNLTVNFDLTSTYTVEEVGYPSAYVIFRNAAGEIIGAAWGSASFETEPQAAVEVTTYDVIPDVDTTEVFIDPGYIYTS
jgi:hypothetical protein